LDGVFRDSGGLTFSVGLELIAPFLKLDRYSAATPAARPMTVFTNNDRAHHSKYPSRGHSIPGPLLQLGTSSTVAVKPARHCGRRAHRRLQPSIRLCARRQDQCPGSKRGSCGNNRCGAPSACLRIWPLRSGEEERELKWRPKSAFERLSHIGSFIAMTPTLNKAIAAHSGQPSQWLLDVSRRAPLPDYSTERPTFFGLVHTHRASVIFRRCAALRWSEAAPA
jgi:hypothetical protein